MDYDQMVNTKRRMRLSQVGWTRMDEGMRSYTALLLLIVLLLRQ